MHSPTSPGITARTVAGWLLTTATIAEISLAIRFWFDPLARTARLAHSRRDRTDRRDPTSRMPPP